MSLPERNEMAAADGCIGFEVGCVGLEVSVTLGCDGSGDTMI